MIYIEKIPGNPWQSTLDRPLTPDQLGTANFEKKPLWIHVKCSSCGGSEACFNRSPVALKQKCLWCIDKIF